MRTGPGRWGVVGSLPPLPSPFRFSRSRPRPLSSSRPAQWRPRPERRRLGDVSRPPKVGVSVLPGAGGESGGRAGGEKWVSLRGRRAPGGSLLCPPGAAEPGLSPCQPSPPPRQCPCATRPRGSKACDRLPAAPLPSDPARVRAPRVSARLPARALRPAAAYAHRGVTAGKAAARLPLRHPAALAGSTAYFLSLGLKKKKKDKQARRKPSGERVGPVAGVFWGNDGASYPSEPGA